LTEDSTLLHDFTHKKAQNLLSENRDIIPEILFQNNQTKGFKQLLNLTHQATGKFSFDSVPLHKDLIITRTKIINNFIK